MEHDSLSKSYQNSGESDNTSCESVKQFSESRHIWLGLGCSMLKKLYQNQTQKPCPFESGLRKFALDPVVVIFFKKLQKNYKWWSDPVVIFFLKWTWSSHCNSFCKQYLCSENHKFRFNYFWTCDFFYINIFCKKKLQRLDKVHFIRNYNAWIRPPLVFFVIFWKKNTTTGSSANFQTDSNGQGFRILKRQSKLEQKILNSALWITWLTWMKKTDEKTYCLKTTRTHSLMATYWMPQIILLHMYIYVYLLVWPHF